jgi:pimeloyl-ACP methyl ester carboxylesterase
MSVVDLAGTWVLMGGLSRIDQSSAVDQQLGSQDLLSSHAGAPKIVNESTSSRRPCMNATRGAPPLPPALPGERCELTGAAGRLSYYLRVPAGPPARPLLLIHSVNAAASAAEVRSLYAHFSAERPVYAIDLPGYGFAERSDRAYTPRLMTDALHAMTAKIRARHGAVQIDAMALSLSCEFLARAALEQPAAYRSLALVSPTGFSGKTPRRGPPGSTRALPRVRRAFRSRWLDPRLFLLLTRPGVIAFFLRKTWGSREIDRELLAYNVLTTRQPGAQYAPFDFLSGGLFSGDVNTLYERLTLPVWMVHGTRGDFVDYRLKQTVEGRPNWHIVVLPTGALPYFELPERFVQDWQRFLDDLPGP